MNTISGWHPPLPLLLQNNSTLCTWFTDIFILKIISIYIILITHCAIHFSYCISEWLLCWEMSGWACWQRDSVSEWARALWEVWPDISSLVHRAEAFDQIERRKSVGGNGNVTDNINVPVNAWQAMAQPQLWDRERESMFYVVWGVGNFVCICRVGGGLWVSFRWKKNHLQ